MEDRVDRCREWKVGRSIVSAHQPSEVIVIDGCRSVVDVIRVPDSKTQIKMAGILNDAQLF